MTTTVSCAPTTSMLRSVRTAPARSSAIRLVVPYPLPVTTRRPPPCTETSAISGLPITMVATRPGSLVIVAWSSITVIGSAARPGAAAATVATSTAARTSGWICRRRQKAKKAVIGTLRTITRIRRPRYQRPHGRTGVDAKLVNEFQSHGRVGGGRARAVRNENDEIRPGLRGGRKRLLTTAASCAGLAL